MNRRRLMILAVCFSLLLLGGLQASAYVRDTIVKYDGACGTLTGFPGVLQTVGFFQHPGHACATLPFHPGICAAVGAKCGGSTFHPLTCKQATHGCVCVAP
mgnify:CR=1 FL=1